MGNVSDNEIVSMHRRSVEKRRDDRDAEAAAHGYGRLTTAPNPRSFAGGFDAGQRGWRLHLVKCDPDTPIQDLRWESALCGVQPNHGWGLDLFIDKECARCTKRFAAILEQSQ